MNASPRRLTHRDQPDSRGACRPVLSIRNDGIERLIGNLPVAPDDPNGLRRWTVAMTRAVATWEVGKAQRGGLNRLAGQGGRR
jgi:hypothetical protein